MRVIKANKITNKYFSIPNELNTNHTYVQLGKQWWEAKYIGSCIGDSKGGDAYWRALKKVTEDVVKSFCDTWISTNEDVRDFVILDTPAKVIVPKIKTKYPLSKFAKYGMRYLVENGYTFTLLDEFENKVVLSIEKDGHNLNWEFYNHIRQYKFGMKIFKDSWDLTVLLDNKRV